MAFDITYVLVYFDIIHLLISVYTPGRRGKVVQCVGYIGMRGAKGKGCQSFWSYIGYGICTPVLNWVCCLEEATFSAHK